MDVLLLTKDTLVPIGVVIAVAIATWRVAADRNKVACIAAEAFKQGQRNAESITVLRENLDRMRSELSAIRMTVGEIKGFLSKGD